MTMAWLKRGREGVDGPSDAKHAAVCVQSMSRNASRTAVPYQVRCVLERVQVLQTRERVHNQDGEADGEAAIRIHAAVVVYGAAHPFSYKGREVMRGQRLKHCRRHCTAANGHTNERRKHVAHNDKVRGTGAKAGHNHGELKGRG